MKSEDTTQLTEALIQVQQAIRPAIKDATNPYFQSNYATLTSVWGACRDALAKNGFAVSQITTFKDGHFFLTTYLLHVSGQWLSGDFLLKPEKDTPQGMGSNVSYARRYSLAALVGVVTEDDDGESAMDRTVKESKPAAHQATQPAPVNTEKHQGNMLTIVPIGFSTKNGSGKKGPWTSFSIKHDGEYYSTFDADHGTMLKDACENKKEVTIAFEANGKYKNIVDVIVNTQREELEEVPF